jgi:inward rectifier potassium channel
VADKIGFSYTKIGARRFDLSDPYHMALTVRWPTFLAGALGLYGLITCAFAGLYIVRPDSVTGGHAGSLADRLFFSIETLATVGYGEMYPATLYGHIVSSAEILTGMAFTAILTGLIFVRFSRPRAKFVFADCAVINRHNGRPTLMVRIGNGRTSILTRTVVQVNVLLNETSPEGARYRRVHELRLIRAAIPIFPLITTFMHEIDDRSPLAGLNLAEIAKTDARLMVSIEAFDPALGTMVQDLKSYGAADIRHGWRFMDSVTVHEDGEVVADLTRISQIEPETRAAFQTTEVFV